MPSGLFYKYRGIGFDDLVIIYERYIAIYGKTALAEELWNVCRYKYLSEEVDAQLD